jgi:alpha-L-fucosidase 2
MANLHRYWLLIIAITSCFNIFSINAADGDFGAWVLNKDGHGGMNAGKLTYEGKDMTLEFWLYIDEAEGKNASGTNIISNRHNGNNGFSVNINKNPATGNDDIRFFLKNSTPDGTASDQVFTLYLPRKEFSNKWAHVAFIISSSEKKAYTFLNGELHEVIEDIYTDWIGNRTTDDLCIGYWYTNPKFYGRLADIRIWNKTRTIDEIKQNYNKPLVGNEANLQLYYNFNNFTQTINNVVNNGKNTGNLLPAATWNTVHSYEVLAQMPTLLSIANGTLTWTADGTSWDVEVRSKTDNSLLKSGTVTEKSFSLAGIKDGFIVRIRTFNNGVYSGWATTQDGIIIGCIGDSNTYGAGASDRNKYAWPIQIRDMIGNDYSTVNLGKSGALMMNGFTDSWTNSSYYTQNKSLNPQIILIALGTNDSKDGYWDPTKFETSYSALIDEFKQYTSHPKIYMISPIKAYSSNWSINDETIRNAVIPKMKEISLKYGLDYIDTYVVTNNMAALVPDGIHPNDEGLKIIARKVADILLAEKPKIEITQQPSNPNHAAYYWYRNDQLITGATNVNYKATETGSYKVAIKLTTGSDDVIVSNPFELTQPNVTLSANCNYLTSATSPTQDKVTISSFANQICITNCNSATLDIFDTGGRLLAHYKLNNETEYINSSFLQKGLYICKIQKENMIISAKISK